MVILHKKLCTLVCSIKTNALSKSTFSNTLRNLLVQYIKHIYLCHFWVEFRGPKSKNYLFLAGTVPMPGFQANTVIYHVLSSRCVERILVDKLKIKFKKVFASHKQQDMTKIVCCLSIICPYKLVLTKAWVYLGTSQLASAVISLNSITNTKSSVLRQHSINIVGLCSNRYGCKVF